MRRPLNTVRATSSRSITRSVRGSRGLLYVLLLIGLVLSACGGGSGSPSGDDGSDGPDQAATGTSGDLETVATLTIDGTPYTFVGIKGGSVVSDDFYCFVGTIEGVSGKLALEGDDGSTLRFTLGISSASGVVTAVLPDDFEHTLHARGLNQDFEFDDFSVTDNSFSVSATILMADGRGGEYDATLEISC